MLEVVLMLNKELDVFVENEDLDVDDIDNVN